jgi:hypothetical protein
VPVPQNKNKNLKKKGQGFGSIGKVCVKQIQGPQNHQKKKKRLGREFKRLKIYIIINKINHIFHI